jgi:superoxide dismutase
MLDKLPVEVFLEILNFIKKQNTIFSLILVNKTINKCFKYNTCKNVLFFVKNSPTIIVPYIKNVSITCDIMLKSIPNISKLMIFEGHIDKFPQRLKELELILCRKIKCLNGLKFADKVVISSCQNMNDSSFKDVIEIKDLDINRCLNFGGQFLKSVRIEKLNINHCPFINNSLEFLSKSIKELQMANTSIVSKDLSPIKELDLLDISSCNINDEAFKTLKIKNTLIMHFVKGKITDKSFSSFKTLTKLYITNNKAITGSGFEHLIKIQYIKLIECSNIVDESLQFLRNAKDITIIKCNKITDTGISHLKSVERLRIEHISDLIGHGFKNLKKLNVVEIYNCVNINKKYIKTSKIRYDFRKLEFLDTYCLCY